MNALISIIPILLLFILMLGFKMAGHKSALITLAVTIIIALFVAKPMGMLPEEAVSDSIVGVVGMSVVEGILKAIFPILLIILMAIYSYNILVESKQIEVIKNQFTSFTDDKGVLVLMLVWGFGGLLEGMAGFGTAVAIPAAILIGLGFKPMFAALVSLIGNTVATGFGAVGVPVTTLCNEVASNGVASHADICQTSAFAVIQLSPLFIIIPFIILMLTDRKAWIKNITLALWTGIVSVVVQYLCARYLGAETPAIIGSIAAIAAIWLYARMTAFLSSTHKNGRQECRPLTRTDDTDTTPAEKKHYSWGETFRAWSVYLLILVFIIFSGALCPPINDLLDTHLVSTIHLPYVDTNFQFGWINNAALMLYLGATIGGLIQGLSFRKLIIILARTLVNLRKTIVTIICLIAMASVMNYSGMIQSIAVGLVTLTGSYYPFFAPLIGAIGTFVTGSDTSSNILFGQLQANVASQLGYAPGAETNWLAAANTTGATGGKMISPQSIAIATASCNMDGKDGEILRSAIPYAIIYIAIGGLIVLLGA